MSNDDKRKINQLIQREQLTCVMNNTKWEELVAGIWQGIDGFYFEYRQKSLLSNDYIAPWDGEWYYHLRPFKEVEWIDIRPAGETSEVALEKLKQLLRDSNIPFSLEDAYVRVWGYVRRGCNPKFR